MSISSLNSQSFVSKNYDDTNNTKKIYSKEQVDEEWKVATRIHQKIKILNNLLSLEDAGEWVAEVAPITYIHAAELFVKSCDVQLSNQFTSYLNKHSDLKANFLLGMLANTVLHKISPRPDLTPEQLEFELTYTKAHLNLSCPRTTDGNNNNNNKGMRV